MIASPTTGGAPRRDPDRSTGPGRAPHVPEEMVRAAMTGDRDAVDRLLGAIRPLVVRYCRGRLGSVDRSSMSADDVAQEVCLAVLAALPRYQPRVTPFLAFVHRIAAYKVVDVHRAVARGRTRPVAEVPDAVAPGPGPEEHALRADLSARLRALLDELPPRQREIVVLRVAVGLSAEETGAVVHASPGAVRVAQLRALARLRDAASRGAAPRGAACRGAACRGAACRDAARRDGGRAGVQPSASTP